MATIEERLDALEKRFHEQVLGSPSNPSAITNAMTRLQKRTDDRLVRLDNQLSGVISIVEGEEGLKARMIAMEREIPILQALNVKVNGDHTGAQNGLAVRYETTEKTVDSIKASWRATVWIVSTFGVFIMGFLWTFSQDQSSRFYQGYDRLLERITELEREQAKGQKQLDLIEKYGLGRKKD